MITKNAKEKPETGALYVISTPIGNLEDITLRALRILNEVDLICAEDTRKTRILLNHFNINTPVTSYYEHNELSKTPHIIQKVKEGKKAAIVSEAGTPTISDPGYRIIVSAIQEDIPVIPIPGPSAALTALSISGLPVHRFALKDFFRQNQEKEKTFYIK